MIRYLALPVIAAAAIIAPATQAWGPTMVGQELVALRALGYQPCEPLISQLPDDIAAEGAVADAATPELHGACQIRFATTLEGEDLNWVAWHEVCHLATVTQIYTDPAHEQMDDPAHDHPLFLGCLDHGPAERGGY